MMRGAAILATVATAGQAETVSCLMGGDVPLRFAIDRNQFAPAVDPNDPPRRQATTVTYGAKTFPAVPFLIGDTRGFEADALGGATAVFVMQPDGAATYAVARRGERVTGRCEVIQ